MLCVFEDLHWADPTTLEMLERLVGRIAGERVLLLITFRPDFTPPWRGRLHLDAISLNRLPRRQGAALAEAVAGGGALPAAVLQQIVARADGVPLFLEELTKAVLEGRRHAEPDATGTGRRAPRRWRYRRPCRTGSWHDSIAWRRPRRWRRSAP